MDYETALVEMKDGEVYEVYKLSHEVCRVYESHSGNSYRWPYPKYLEEKKLYDAGIKKGKFELDKYTPIGRYLTDGGGVFKTFEECLKFYTETMRYKIVTIIKSDNFEETF